MFIINQFAGSSMPRVMSVVEGGLGDGGAAVGDFAFLHVVAADREEGGDAQQADRQDAERDQDLGEGDGAARGGGLGTGELGGRRNDECTLRDFALGLPNHRLALDSRLSTLDSAANIVQAFQFTSAPGVYAVRRKV